MTWQAGGLQETWAVKTDLRFFCAEGRESRVGRYLGLMPGVDVRRQDKNQRKFSGARLRLASWIRTKPQVWRESRVLPHGGEKIDWKLAALSLYAPLEFSF